MTDRVTERAADGVDDPAATPRLAVEDLRVHIDTDEGKVLAVDGLSFSLRAGQVLALVGESGCGKSMTAMAILGLLPPGGTATGSVRLDGREILNLPQRALREIRGRHVSMIFQEPMTSLNPVFSVGYQIVEVLTRHRGLDRAAARRRAIELLDLVRIPAPGLRIDEYPHQLSGGMRQRAMIAMAVACDPHVLIADEPTTALDVTMQAQILDILRDLRAQLGTSIVMITHDLGVVADIADTVTVMYAGQLAESATVDDLFRHPQHPYTLGLLGAVPRPGEALAGGSPGAGTPRLQEIPGMVPTVRERPAHCVFAPRCPRAQHACRTEPPPVVEPRGGHRVACYYPGPAAGERPGADAHRGGAR